MWYSAAKAKILASQHFANLFGCMTDDRVEIPYWTTSSVILLSAATN